MISRRTVISAAVASSFAVPAIVRADDKPTVVMTSYYG
jgi:hypothetical protein